MSVALEPKNGIVKDVIVPILLNAFAPIDVIVLPKTNSPGSLLLNLSTVVQYAKAYDPIVCT